MEKKGLGKGLGKGLDTFFIEDDSNSDIREIEIGKIYPDPDQHRKTFHDETIKELADSIKVHGIIQPLIVRKEGTQYKIVAGERRYRAAQLAGLERLPVIVRDDISDRDAAEIALIENLQREELNPIEEALAYKSLIKNYSVTQEEISEAVGKSRPHITNTLRLLNLPKQITDMIDQGQITAGHGKAILRLSDENLQIELANKVIAEELSVRATETLAKKITEENIKEVPKKVKEKDVFIVDVEERLRNIFGTKVNISKGKKKGKIEIEYYNEDELNNIVSMLLEEN